MALATYCIVGLTLRPVAALRHGAADITAAGLAEQRLPVPDAQDEIQRLAVTLNAMLDRIDSATKRQRTFVGDAAHELRSPLASLRVQLEVAQRLGPAADWHELVDDVAGRRRTGSTGSSTTCSRWPGWTRRAGRCAAASWSTWTSSSTSTVEGYATRGCR